MKKMIPGQNIKNISLLLIFFFALIISQTGFGQSTVTNPASPWVAPAGVNLTVHAWGGGGAGGGSQNTFLTTRFGGGGGGGGYSKATVNNAGGQSFTNSVGAGGTVPGSNQNGGAGGSSTVTGPSGLLITAVGGGGGVKSTGANGGTAGGGNTFNGGTGGTGTDNGAGGGGGAGSASAGVAGTNAAAGPGGAGSPNSAPYKGGSGGAPPLLGLIAPGTGAVPGGGGAGGVSFSGTSSGAVGGAGQVVYSYTCPTYSLTGGSSTVACIAAGTSTITLTGTAAGLPTGGYTVTYNRSSPVGTALQAAMTVTTAGTGTFTAVGLTSIGTSNITITSLSSGSVPSPCTSTISANNVRTVTVSAPPASLTYTLNTVSYCAGSLITNNSPSNSGGVPTLYGVAPALPTGLSLNTATGVISGTPTVATGAANYTITASNSCGSTTKAVNITVNALPTVTGISGGALYCTGQTPGNIIVAVTGTGPWSVSFTKNGIGQPAATGASSPVSLGNAPGVYVVTGVSDANCSNSAGGTQTITINSLPTVTSVTGGNSYCAGTTPSNILAAVTGTGPWSVAFTLNGTAQTAATGPGSPVSLGNAAGVYVVTGVSDANCSNAAGGTQTITINPVPAVYTLTGSTICASQPNTGTMNLSNSQTGFNYQLKDGGGNVQAALAGTGSQLSWSGLPAGNGYYVVATGVSPTNCSTQTATANVSVYANLSATNVKTNKSACNNTNDGTITVTPGGGSGSYSYSWTGQTGIGAHNSYTAGNVSSVSGLDIGYYNVTVTDLGGCGITSITGIHIEYAYSVLVTNSGSISSSCGNTGSIILYGNAGLQPYTYAISAVNAVPAGTYQATNTFNNLAAGTYTAYIKDAGGCESSKPVTISAAAPVSVSPYARAASSCASDGSVDVYRSGGIPPYKYFVSLSSSPAPASGDYINSNSFTGLAAGNYIAYVMDSKGCTGSQPVTVSQGAGLSVTYTKSNTSTCTNDGGIQVNASGGVPGLTGYQYKLDNGSYQSSNLFTGLGAGNYTIYVKDSKGCTANPMNVNIGLNPIMITYSVVNASSCLTPNGSIQLFRTGGVGPYMYSLDGNNYQNSNFFPGKAAGSYMGFVRDSKFCTASQDIIVGPSCGRTIPTARTTAQQPLTKIIVNSSLKLQAYPNPSASGFTLQLDGYNRVDKIIIIVTDIMGRKVYQSETSGKSQYTFGNNLQAGLYMVQVEQGNKKQTLRLIKE